MSAYTGLTWSAMWIDDYSMITPRAWKNFGRRTVRWRGKKHNYRKVK